MPLLELFIPHHLKLVNLLHLMVLVIVLIVIGLLFDRANSTLLLLEVAGAVHVPRPRLRKLALLMMKHAGING